MHRRVPVLIPAAMCLLLDQLRPIASTSPEPSARMDLLSFVYLQYNNIASCDCHGIIVFIDCSYHSRQLTPRDGACCDSNCTPKAGTVQCDAGGDCVNSANCNSGAGTCPVRDDHFPSISSFYALNLGVGCVKQA
jgi:hypothetical protein